MICAKCGADAGDFSYCPNCGEEIQVLQACLKCGADVQGHNFCPNCGEKVPKVHLCVHCGADTKGCNYCPNCGEEVIYNVVCLNCGADVQGHNFCPNCGTNVKKWNTILPVEPITPVRKRVRKPKVSKPEPDPGEAELKADLAEEKSKASVPIDSRKFLIASGIANVTACLAYAIFLFLTNDEQIVPVYSGICVFVLTFFFLFLSRIRRNHANFYYPLLTAIQFLSLGFKVAYIITHFHY